MIQFVDLITYLYGDGATTSYKIGQHFNQDLCVTKVLVIRHYIFQECNLQE